MYVPFWLFDSDVTASAEFRAETDTVYETNDETVTETSVYRCDRQGTMRFQRIPVDGSQKMDDTYMESIEPYDYHDKWAEVTVNPTNLFKILDGKLNPVIAYTTGKVSISGDVDTVLRFVNLAKSVK